MRTEKLLIALTIANSGLLTGQLTRTVPVEPQGVPPVLRTRKLEIVDDEGRVRANIRVHPEAKSQWMPNGKAYPDTVSLRLIDPEGCPAVKIGASERGGGVGLVGEADASHVFFPADGLRSSLKLKNNDSQQQFIQP